MDQLFNFTVYAGSAGVNSRNLANYYSFGKLTDFGELINIIIPVLIVIIFILLLFFLLFSGWGYLTSGGNKESIAKARSTITHTLIGVALFFLLFIILRFLLEAFGIKNNII